MLLTVNRHCCHLQTSGRQGNLATQSISRPFVGSGQFLYFFFSSNQSRLSFFAPSHLFQGCVYLLLANGVMSPGAVVGSKVIILQPFYDRINTWRSCSQHPPSRWSCSQGGRGGGRCPSGSRRSPASQNVKWKSEKFTVGSRSTKTALGVWTPVPVSAKNVLKELSVESIDSSFCNRRRKLWRRWHLAKRNET